MRVHVVYISTGDWTRPQRGLAPLGVIAKGHPHGVIDNGCKGFEFEKKKIPEVDRSRTRIIILYKIGRHITMEVELFSF